MATTSLWHIKGRLKDLIDYVENPEKTVSKDKCLQDFYNVFSYVSRPEATENGEYVSAINCLKVVMNILSTTRTVKFFALLYYEIVGVILTTPKAVSKRGDFAGVF